VSEGQFFVIAENPRSSQSFNWEVKAHRADVDQFVAEQ
jgi:hypothetical protein